MKKFYIFLIALFVMNGAMAQTAGPCSTCLPEGITFTTQAQIDNFQTNHPGCTVILGHLTINGADINNLNGLNVLTSIEGAILITANPELTSLAGLESLTSIGGNLSIYGNPALTSATGLESLALIGGSLNINANSLLSSLNGLQGLTSIVGNMVISYGYSLTSLTGLNGLNSIGGNVSITGDNVLSSLTGIESLTTIGGNLAVDGNDSLASLTGLEGLTSIGGNLSIYGNLALVSLDGLESLTSVGGSLDIIYNFALTSLDGLDNIAPGSITGLNLANNPILSNCNVQSICDYVAAPNGSVEIHDNATGCNSPVEVIVECDSLLCIPNGIIFSTQAQIDDFQINYPNCTNIYGDVTIGGSDIANLNGLSVLTSIGGSLYIEDYYPGNPVLTNLTGLEGLTYIGGNLEISRNEALTNLTGLNNLTTIGGDFLLGHVAPYSWGGNPALTSLTGLESLSSIGGSIQIMADTSLTSLTGLESLTSVGGGIEVSYNDSLTSLAGLDHIDGNTISYLYINDNYSLSTCAIESICDYLAAPNGDVYIGYNATGCNDPEEVNSACNYLSTGALNLQPAFSIYPNPCYTVITIDFPETTTPGKNKILTIYTVNSREIVLLPVTEPRTVVDVSGWSPGIYMVKMVSDDGVMVGKFVKE